MVKIQIDGKYYDVKSGKNLLETCLGLGIDIPHFCYHPALGSVGACRLCAVKKFKDANDKKGRIIMSCMEPVTDGLIISVEDEEAKKFRAAIIESLMVNHPHDCPVCDEGGECHLQDMTVMTGHNYRRFEFKKRTYKNQFLGPFINHEMNRCIQCYRCVRFYKDYAGGNDLNVFASHDHVYFGRHEEGILKNEFSGNLAEVCPTGVFTDKTLKEHFTRKWDLMNAPSICVHCGVGCNLIIGERYGLLRRVMSRYNGSVNGYFICDRGRFGYEFVNDEKRIRKSQIRFSKNKELENADKITLQKVLSDSLSHSKKIIGIGSTRASIEANFALTTLVGKENFYHGINEKEKILIDKIINILKSGTVHSPSLKEIEKADAVLILGEDVTNSAPMVALALRQAARNVPNEISVKSGSPAWHDIALRNKAQNLKSPVFIATTFKTKLDDLAENIYRASPADIARLGFSVASILDNKVPAVNGLNQFEKEMSEQIAGALKNANHPLIISGIHSGSEDILHASANIAQALSSPVKKVFLSLIVPECNSVGLGMMEGKSLDEAITLINYEEVDTLIILENDLYRRTDKESVDSIFEKCKNIIVLDHLENETTLKADILLPVGTFAESQGTLVNNEGRAQRFYNVFPINKPVIESWRCIRDLIEIKNKNQTSLWNNFNDVASDLTDHIPAFSKIKSYQPDADLKMLNEKIARQTIRFSGRTAMNANTQVSEPKPPEDTDSPLAFSMEGYKKMPPSSLTPYYWSPGWNSVQAMYKYVEEPNGSLKGGDPGVWLFEEQEEQEVLFYNSIPLTFESRSDALWIVPVYQIFGSDELSSKGTAIAKRIQAPFIRINQKEAEKNDVHDNEIIQIVILNNLLKVKVKIENSVPEGIGGLSFLLPGMPYLNLPAWGKLNNI